jgi:hypothetical protein
LDLLRPLSRRLAAPLLIGSASRVQAIPVEKNPNSRRFIPARPFSKRKGRARAIRSPLTIQGKVLGDELLFRLGLMFIRRVQLPTTFAMPTALRDGSAASAAWIDTKTQQLSPAADCCSQSTAHVDMGGGGVSYAEVFP